MQSTINRASLAEGPARHFKSYHGLHLALRISGETKAFETGQDERPRKMRGKPYATMDWVLGEDDWRDRSDAHLAHVLSQRLTECFEKLLSFARDRDELLDEALSRDVFKDILKQAGLTPE